MTYFPQQAPPNIQTIDELRQWAEEEFRRIGQHTAELEGPWLAYTPTLTPAAGSFTAASASGRYKQIGKTVHLSAQINITTLGTATGGFAFSLPAIGVAKDYYVLPVNEALVVALMGWARIIPGGASAFVLRYDNANYMANGYRLITSGTYELA